MDLKDFGSSAVIAALRSLASDTPMRERKRLMEDALRSLNRGVSLEDQVNASYDRLRLPPHTTPVDRSRAITNAVRDEFVSAHRAAANGDLEELRRRLVTGFQIVLGAIAAGQTGGFSAAIPAALQLAGLFESGGHP